MTDTRTLLDAAHPPPPWVRRLRQRRAAPGPALEASRAGVATLEEVHRSLMMDGIARVPRPGEPSRSASWRIPPGDTLTERVFTGDAPPEVGQPLFSHLGDGSVGYWGRVVRWRPWVDDDGAPRPDRFSVALSGDLPTSEEVEAFLALDPDEA